MEWVDIQTLVVPGRTQIVGNSTSARPGGLSIPNRVWISVYSPRNLTFPVLGLVSSNRLIRLHKLKLLSILSDIYKV